MNIHDEVNLIIFRIPDEPDKETEWDDGFRLVELHYLDQKLAEVGMIFLPHPDDANYRSIDFDRIVLARITADGSKELARYQLNENQRKVKAKTIHEMERSEMIDAVKLLVTEYNIERSRGV